jgi:glutamate dehydrogenase (NADP+)
MRYCDATQQRQLNEEDEAKALVANGCICVAGKNLTCQLHMVQVCFHKSKIIRSRRKKHQMGRVAASRSRNVSKLTKIKWTAEEVDEKIKGCLAFCASSCVEYGTLILRSC